MIICLAAPAPPTLAQRRPEGGQDADRARPRPSPATTPNARAVFAESPAGGAGSPPVLGPPAYQKGIWRFSKDGKTSLQNHPENVRSLELLLRMWNDNIWPEQRDIAAFMRREAGHRLSLQLVRQHPAPQSPRPQLPPHPAPHSVRRGRQPATSGFTTRPRPLSSPPPRVISWRPPWLLMKGVISDEDANAELVRQHSSTPNWAKLQGHRALKDDQGVQTVAKLVRTPSYPAGSTSPPE